jgi:uncharacterized lipoprotein YbaY
VRGYSIVVTGLVALVSCAPATRPQPRPAARKGILSGTVVYQDASPLPHNALVRVWVWDTFEPPEVSTVGQAQFPASGVGPIPFVLFFDPDLIQRGHPYVVRASISVDGAVLFESPLPVAVLTQGASSIGLGLVVKRVVPAPLP